MPFAVTSKTLILKHRAYQVRLDQYTSSTLSELIDEQMSDIEDNLPEMIPTIEADLATLESLDALLTTEQGSTNNALIQADSLKWAEGGKVGGIQQRYESLRMRVALLLSNAIVESGSSTQGTLMRG